MFYLSLLPVVLGSLYYINKQNKIEKAIKITLAILSIAMIALVLIEFTSKVFMPISN